MTKKKLFPLLILFLLPLAMGFSQTAKITGTVYDSTKRPLSQVSISQKHSRNTVITNKNGNYSLQLPIGDSLKISFFAIGFQQLDITIPHLTEDVAELDIILKNIEKDLESVTISAEGKSRTVSMIVDIFDSKRRSFLLDSSIESLISSVAGVSSTNELSNQYQVRGGNFDENIVYVNGIEIYRPLLIRSGQQEGLSFINPNMVQSVGFSTGGYNAEYGDKMSSVLDITYKKPTKLEGSVGASLMDGSVYVGNSTKRFSQMTSVRYKQNHSLLNTTDTKAEYDPSFLDLQSYITYNFSPKWEAGFLANYSRNIYQFTPTSRTTTFGSLYNIKEFHVDFDGWEDDKFLTYQLALNVNGKLSDKVDIGFAASTFSSDEQEYYDITGSYRLTEPTEPGGQGGELMGIGRYHEHARNKLDVDVYNIKHFGNLKIDKHHLKWGLSFQREYIKDKIKEWEMRDSTGFSLPSNGVTVNVYSNLKSDNKINSTRISGFLQEHYLMNTDAGLFAFNAGVRGSYWNFNKEFIVSPRFSVNYIPSTNDNFNLRFAAGIYYQSPFYKEYRQTVDIDGNNTIVLNKDIKSERSEHFVLGGDYNFKGGEQQFKFTTELFYKGLHDLIPYTVNNVKIRYSGQNEGKGYVAGIDMRLYGEFVPGTSSWLSFSLMKTEREVGGIKTPLPTDQVYNISLYYQDYFPGYERLKMNLKGSFVQGLPISAPHKGLENGYFRTPAYKRVDIGFTWEVLGENYEIRKTSSFCKTFKNIWLGLDILNLFDMKNVNTYYWISDVNRNQHPVPNYLTGRQLNIRLLADF